MMYQTNYIPTIMEVDPQLANNILVSQPKVYNKSRLS